MKKIITLSALALMALTANAKDYTDQLAITLNGQAQAPSEAVISVEKGSDNLYDIVLKQFSFQGLLIGDVTIEDVNSDDAGDGYTYFKPVTKEAAITNGSAIAEMLGGKVTVTVKDGSKVGAGQYGKDKLYMIINLPVALPYGTFDVDAVFGTGNYQIENSGFEYFHTETFGENTSDEPNAWHSFMSCTGDYASLVASTPHTFIGEEARPGSFGTKSVKVVSGKVLGFVPANGTITTGQMQAGHMLATNPANCAFLDFENKEVDDNGDPFYTIIEGQPDSLAVWVKFKQGVLSAENADYKYASISAILTNGGYYQDPGDSIAANVVAKALNNKIESNDFAWQRIVIPFDYASYASNNATAKALLVTITTNAQPGVGSTSDDEPDCIYVDDIELVYNNTLTGLNIKGTDIALEAGKTEYTLDGQSGSLTLDDITAEADGQGAIIKTSIENNEEGAMVTVNVTSNDMVKTNTYNVLVKGVTTGVDKVETTTVNGVKAIYTLDGRRVNSMAASGIYIVRKTDGSTVKVLNK